MTLTVLDPTTALIVVDLQKAVIALPGLGSVEEVVDNAAALAAEFRARQLPVVLVTVAGGAPGRTEQVRVPFTPAPGGADLVPQLDQQPGDHLIVKHSWGAFTGTGLDELLRRLGVTQVVITGVVTSAGVESTARAAHELGYNVTLAVDAMTDRNDELHEHSVSRVFPRIGETGSTAEILELLAATGA